MPAALPLIRILEGYAPPPVPMPVVQEGIILHSASYRVDNLQGPLLRATWIMISRGGYTSYLRAHEARAGYLRNGTKLRPITIATTYGRNRTRRGAVETHMAPTPSPSGMMTAYDATFQNAAGTVTRTAKIVLDTSRSTIRV